MNSNTLLPCASVPTKCWSAAHHGYLVRFNYTFTKACHVLGSKELANSWIIKPAIGLGHNPPCTLLAEPAGFSVINELLIRIEYGVYT
ncbi:antitoxin Xre/MbcA/ParS toxin-binding domain-containing protein [Pseudomonas entomophila]|uniref:antitoxin Xre/MbcA/ParS toxin-binding domain-containing protein n=1 Tax=Pseudomonas entomophila TaxID=312306 RepID=UPI003D2F8478